MDRPLLFFGVVSNRGPFRTEANRFAGNSRVPAAGPRAQAVFPAVQEAEEGGQAVAAVRGAE